MDSKGVSVSANPSTDFSFQDSSVSTKPSKDDFSVLSSDLVSEKPPETTEAIDVEKVPAAEPTPPYTTFSPSRQIAIILIVTAAGFFSPLCGAVYLPSLILFEKIFKTTSAVINASVSVYWAVFGIAPLFGAAASDYGGRKTVYVISLAVFLVSNGLLAALPPTLGGLFTLRVFQALGSSMVTSIGAGTVADVTEPARRGSRMAIFLLGPQLGPLLGPLIGGQFSDESRWRWIFGFLSIACLPVYLLILFALPETLRCLVGNGSVYAGKGWFAIPKLRQKQLVDNNEYPKPPRPTFKGLFSVLLFVPNCIVSFASAFNFAGLSSMYVVFPRVWQRMYGFSGSETGYTYIAPGVAIILSSLLVGRLSDLLHRRYKARNNGSSPPPEMRVDMQVYAYMLAAVGKVLFGWFVLKHYHAAAILIATAIAAGATGMINVLCTSYQTECMPTAAASLVALSAMLRNVGSAMAAAIIDALLEKMGYGWCFTGLAILDIVCITGLVFIRLRGHVFREKLNASNLGVSPLAPKP
ncbi:MFS general substrate transporter [Westerdykella ornata]|uniref:MFS general substrate transporter n=1 Tax=Westerdykella ornata TaxID=318751 RepID=A0A6A6JRI3_WESOR|nr:MFS general substrate transporter [Westerdykella ornata]KAF2278855.1 MFS general substrate transporter [Westerdykella ornata]